MQHQRQAFFAETLACLARPPTDYPDAMPRKKRVLEELPIAPPLAPRLPSAAELEQQAQNDARLREYLKFRLGPILIELKKRFKKFLKPIGDGAEIEIVHENDEGSPAVKTKEIIAIEDDDEADGAVVVTARRVSVGHAPGPDKGEDQRAQVNGHAESGGMEGVEAAHGDAETGAEPVNGAVATQGDADEGDKQEAIASKEPKVTIFRFHEVGLEKIESRLYRDKYLTPESFLEEIHRIVENAYHDGETDTISKADQMLNNTRIMVDQACDAGFRHECTRMAQREADRARIRLEKKAKSRDEKEKAKGQADDGAASLEKGKGKRTREEEAADIDGAAGEDEGDRAKRARIGDTDMVDADTARNTLINGQTQQIGLRDTVPEPPSPNLLSTFVSLVNGRQSASPKPPASLPAPPVALASAGADASAPARRSPSPPPAPFPPFVLPERPLASLSRFLVDETAELTVDELEQLRAACYDCIWRARREWDKTALIAEVDEMAREFVQEVKESHGQDQA